MSERPSDAEFLQNEADGRATEAEWLQGFYADGHEVRAADPHRADGVPIASLARSLLPTEEIHALAKVFAASPMLLAALKSAEKFHDELCGMIAKAFYAAEEQGAGDKALVDLAKALDQWMGNGWLASYRDEFRTAIAKAEGSAP